MRLLPDWKRILRRAWSVRLILLAACLSALPVFMSLVNSDMLGVDPVWFAALAAGANVLAFIARFMVQSNG